jgi:CBS domain-containing protein
LILIKAGGAGMWQIALPKKGGGTAMNREMSQIIRQQKPLTLPPEATVQQACKQMFARKAGAVLVVNERSRLLGIFTGRDAVRVLAKGKDPAATALKDVMTKKPASMPPHSTAIEALA